MGPRSRIGCGQSRSFGEWLPRTRILIFRWRALRRPLMSVPPCWTEGASFVLEYQSRWEFQSSTECEKFFLRLTAVKGGNFLLFSITYEDFVYLATNCNIGERIPVSASTGSNANRI